MPVSIDICNQALSEIGANRITGISDPTLEATQCKIHYMPVLRHLLAVRNWTFATKRRELAQSTQSPSFGYARSFTLPADCLRVRRCTDAGDRPFTRWVVEDKAVSVDSEVCFIEYTALQEDASTYSGPFEQCMVHMLASRLAVPVMQSKSMKEMHYGLYKDLISEASGLDGSQGSPTRIGLGSSRLISARRR